MSVVIQSGFTGIAEPIDQPRICFDTHTATPTATSTATGADVAWLVDGETWSVWEGGSTSQTVTLTFSSAATSYAAIAAHNLGSTGATVTCRAGGVTVGSISPDDDGAIVFLFGSTTVTTVAFTISGGSAAPQIAVAQAGEVLEMPQLSVFTGLPISESKQVRYRHQQSIRGDVLGRAVEGADLRFDLTVQNLPETFRAASGDVTWKGFINHVDNTGPFFIAAKPFSYPDDVAYARAMERPRFNRERANLNNSGAVTFQCMGYAAP
ncbi:MAG: hypothetical protein P1U85_22330 [Verrucomicrobiales bacterium]|nr:hypothetical protein [Verrucomicrobiales bacterium]